MRRRAELVDETRSRIVEAAMRLHTTVGPSATSIAGIAEAAGVTRLTVYRHFPDLELLFEACRAHWISLHPRPDPAGWRRISDLETRARRAFTQLYGFYRRNEDELYPIHRDRTTLPRPAQAAIRRDLRSLGGAIVGDDTSAGTEPRVGALAAHLVDFLTWRSLTEDHGLGDHEAVELATTLVVAVRSDREPGGSRPRSPSRTARPTAA